MPCSKDGGMASDFWSVFGDEMVRKKGEAICDSEKNSQSNPGEWFKIS